MIGYAHLLKRLARYVIPGFVLVLCCIPILSSDPIPIENQPYPDAMSYAREAVQIANGNGFKIDFDESMPLSDQDTTKATLLPSRYPPGFSILLSPFVELGKSDENSAIQLGSKLASLSLLLMIFLLAWVLGPLAAIIAAGVSVWSPFLVATSRLVMTDALGAALTISVIACCAIATQTKTRKSLQNFLFVIAGMATGLGVITRVSLATTLIALLVTTRSLQTLRYVLLGVLPFLIFLGTYQWTEFGHPLKTGYSYYLPTLKEFSPSFILRENPPSEREFIFQEKLNGSTMKWSCPCDIYGPVGKANNAVFYPAVLVGLYWFYFPPLFAIFGLWALWVRRKCHIGRLAIAVILLNVFMVLPYFYQGVRLVSPAAFTLLAFSAVGLTQLLNSIMRKLQISLSPPARFRASSKQPVS